MGATGGSDVSDCLMAEVPEFALTMMELRGMQPHVQLMDDTWGHDAKCVEACEQGHLSIV